MIKLIVLDLDNTLTNPWTNKIKLIDQQAIMAAQQSGVQVMISTGRSHSRKVQVITEKLQLDQYNGVVFCLNGGLFYQANDNLIQKVHQINPAVIQKIIVRLQATKMFAVFASDQFDVVWTLKSSWISPFLRAITWLKIRKITPAELSQQKIVSVFIFRKIWRNQRFTEFKAFGQQLNLTVYTYKNLFIQLSTTNKGNGLRQYMQKHQLQPEQVMVIGDSENDIEMMQAVKYRIAVANASPRILALSYDQVPAYNQGGVAAAINKYVLT